MLEQSHDGLQNRDSAPPSRRGWKRMAPLVAVVVGISMLASVFAHAFQGSGPEQADAS
jgi:hypothetical protein